MLFAFIELLADAVAGIVIRLDTRVIATDHLTMLARPWGPGPLHDQQLGGDLMWGVGEAIDLPFIVMLLVQWCAPTPGTPPESIESLTLSALRRSVSPKLRAAVPRRTTA
jgi:putative membrane protein